MKQENWYDVDSLRNKDFAMSTAFPALMRKVFVWMTLALAITGFDELKDLAKDLDIAASDIKKAKKAKALIDLIIDSVDEEDILEALGEDSDEEDEDDEEGDQDYSEMHPARRKNV